jgi:tetratricopeptide (TPR) repeat protein
MRQLGTRDRIGFVAWTTLVLSASSTVVLATPASEHLLEEGVREYRAALECTDRDERLSRFHRAELLFQQLVDGQGDRENGPNRVVSADLYANLGNAALGGERLGPAVLAYRRALAIDPDHDRAFQNLDHARTLLPDWVPKPERSGLLDSFFGWSHRLSRAELRTRAAIAFFVATALVALSIRWRQTVLRHLAVIPAIIWLLLLAVMTLRSTAEQGSAAVVVVSEVVARSADSAGAPARLAQHLPGGTEVQLIEQRDEWIRVRLFDGRDAWLPSSAVERVTR